MSLPLPTSHDLEGLSFRALVAYSARGSDRVSFQLHGIVDRDLVDELFARIVAVCTTYFVSQLEESDILGASQRLTAAMIAAHSPEKAVYASSLRLSGMVACMAIHAANEPARAQRCMTRAARWAEMAVSITEFLGNEARAAATKAARSDFLMLQREYGVHNEVTMGDLIECFGDDILSSKV
jgi:hypothetical protein